MTQFDHEPLSDSDIDEISQDERMREDSIAILALEAFNRLDIAGIGTDERMMIVMTEAIGAAYDRGLRNGFDQGYNFVGEIES